MIADSSRAQVVKVVTVPLSEVAQHALECWPDECCGYITDVVVRCTNADRSGSSFAIDGAELFGFARAFDSPNPPRILYHSHTNGRAYVSETDRAASASYQIQHLVVGIAAEGVTEAALFDEHFVEIERWVLG
jgi:[CysO sulfur-carrier protein]-S-L-cysteine hydrolase